MDQNMELKTTTMLKKDRFHYAINISSVSEFRSYEYRKIIK